MRYLVEAAARPPPATDQRKAGLNLLRRGTLHNSPQWSLMCNLVYALLVETLYSQERHLCYGTSVHGVDSSLKTPLAAREEHNIFQQALGF